MTSALPLVIMLYSKQQECDRNASWQLSWPPTLSIMVGQRGAVGTEAGLAALYFADQAAVDSTRRSCWAMLLPALSRSR